jgi:hypothetical protein
MQLGSASSNHLDAQDSSSAAAHILAKFSVACVGGFRIEKQASHYASQVYITALDVCRTHKVAAAMVCRTSGRNEHV